MLPNPFKGEFPLRSRWSHPLFTGTYSDGFFENMRYHLFGNTPHRGHRGFFFKQFKFFTGTYCDVFFENMKHYLSGNIPPMMAFG